MLWDARSIFKNGIAFGKAPAPLSFCRMGYFPPLSGRKCVFLGVIIWWIKGKGTLNCAFVTGVMSCNFLYP